MGRAFPALVLTTVSAACATVHSSVQVITAPGTPGTGPVPVYYALAPPFAYAPVGEIHVVADGDRAHLEDLLAEAETRARGLGADAVLVHDVRTDARYVRQLVWRQCTSYGPVHRSLGGACATPVNVLTIQARLEATAVRRDPNAASPGVLWRPPPALGAVGTPDAPSPPPEPAFQDLDELLTPPP